MKHEWIDELVKRRRLFTYPYCEKRHFVEYFECTACGFIFEVSDRILMKIYKELKEVQSC